MTDQKATDRVNQAFKTEGSTRGPPKVPASYAEERAAARKNMVRLREARLGRERDEAANLGSAKTPK
jgi:hypothetical protein